MTFTYTPYKVTEFVPLIQELIRLYKPETYVEIGIRKAYTFNNILRMNEIKRAVAVDISIHRNINQSDPRVEVYEMSSLEFAKVWKDPIDLLFIDADHNARSVIADFNVLSPFVPKGHGLILLHDTHPNHKDLLKEGYCYNAWEAARTIHRHGLYADWEIVTLPGPYAGLSIIRNAEKHLAWRENGTIDEHLQG
jgi:hypothetical protein